MKKVKLWSQLSGGAKKLCGEYEDCLQLMVVSVIFKFSLCSSKIFGSENVFIFFKKKKRGCLCLCVMGFCKGTVRIRKLRRMYRNMYIPKEMTPSGSVNKYLVRQTLRL